jgi:hypothetical protein
MKKMLALTFVGMFAGLSLCGGSYAADAATATTAMTPQQEKMKSCNASAADKKGDDRKAYMKTCLSAAPAKPQSKMAMCNSKTKGMAKADADKARSECMKAS